MARRIRKFRQKAVQDSGFGSNSSGRFVNKDGFPNVEKRGVNILNRFSWYHTLMEFSTTRFLSYMFLGYLLINLVFAIIYYFIGIEHLTGIDKSSPVQEFIDVFFFSSQTFTTVGYGRIAPVGFLASLMATLEAFLGLLGFAIATGLFFGRFSRPRAFLKFSKVALIAPYQEVTALMFRMASYKNNALSDGEVILTAAIETNENGETKSNFYNLNVELRKINTLSLNWTIVHKIDEDSPFYGFTEEDFQDKDTDIEIIVQIRAFDEVFANTVVQRTSYINSEIIYGAKFVKMYDSSEDQRTTILDLSKINNYQKAELPKIVSES